MTDLTASEAPPRGTIAETIEGVSCVVGRDPRDMSVADLAEAGHERRPVLAAIRAHCIECSGGSIAEARRCTVVRCNLWPFRLNHNPFRETREMTDEQRAAAAERFRKAREARGHD